MASMTERLRDAMNSHDPSQMAALVASDYVSTQPVHPARDFTGRAQVMSNWTSVFDGVPDFTAELIACAVEGAMEWGEWDWRGRHADGSAFAMRGVTILRARENVVSEMRLYVEPVEDAGDAIDAAVSQLYS